MGRCTQPTRGLVRGRRWTHPELPQETGDLPGSWGTPVHACPALRPRWVDLPWPSMDKPMLPSGKFTPSAPQLSPFRGSMTRPTCALSTLHDAGYPAIAQDALPVCWLSINWTGLAPAGFHSRISRWHCSLLSQRARLSWRTNFERTGGANPDERAVELRQNTWLNRKNELLVHAPASLVSRSVSTWPNFLVSLD